MTRLTCRARLVSTLAILLLMTAAGAAMAASPVIIYDSIPAPLPPNVPSLGYQSTQTSEFGDLIQFIGTNRTLMGVSVVMSDWALASDYPTYPGASGPSWSHPLTLNLYNVDNSGANPAPGTLIATRTKTFAIPWRPPADPTCPDPMQYRGSDGKCYSGLAFIVTFDFSGTIVPNQIIYGLVFNTQTWGPNPIGSAGPYISLNFGLAQVPPTVGSNPFPDTAYWNTATAANYTDGGAAGVGTFRRDTAWSPFSGAVSFATADADLAVTKAGPATITAGSDITYTVTVTNNGLSDAQSVTLTDALPPGTTFASEAQSSGPAFGCTNPAPGASGSVSCSIATLVSGASASFTLVFHVNASAANGSTITNTATVSSTTSDSVPGNNSQSTSATVGTAADVAVTKAGPATVTAGNNITYTVTVMNNGPSDAQNVSLTDAAPANTSFISATQNSGPAFNCNSSSGTVTCTIATFASAASATFTIVDAVNIATPGNTTITNTANVNSATTPDPNPSNNSSSAASTVSGGAVDISITKTASAQPYGTGLPITYTIVVSNAGPASAGSVTVTDVIPPGTTFSSATPSQGSCSGTSTVTCSLGTIANGGSATISLVVNLPSAPGPVSNTATVTSANADTNPANNSSTSTVTVIQASAIPAISPPALLLLILMITLLGAIRLRT